MTPGTQCLVVRLLSVCCQVDKTQLMDVLKEEPSFSHDHFSEVKAASTGHTEENKVQDASGGLSVTPICVHDISHRCKSACN